MRSTAFRALGLIGFGLGPTILLAGCGDTETGARTTLNSIQPSSYVVRPPATTTTTLPDADAGVGEDGRSDLPQEYTVQPGDYPLAIATRYDIPLDELAAFNEWTPPNYSEFPLPGTTIGIPPGALVPGASGGDSSGDGGTTGGDDGTTDDGTADDGTAGDGTADDEADEGSDVPDTTLAGSDGECVPGEHEIVEGDIPVKVAEQYDITLEQLEAANAGNPAYQQFIVGQRLRIPCD